MDVKCPLCEKSVPWDESSRWKPFCSERCRLIDLGQWAAEEHRIPGQRAEPTDSDKNPH